MSLFSVSNHFGVQYDITLRIKPFLGALSRYFACETILGCIITLNVIVSANETGRCDG